MPLPRESLNSAIKPSPVDTRQLVAEQIHSALNHPGSQVAQVFSAIDYLTRKPENPIPPHQVVPIGYPQSLPPEILANATAYRKNSLDN